jgi:hypothetical protein
MLYFFFIQMRKARTEVGFYVQRVVTSGGTGGGKFPSSFSLGVK